MNEKNVEKSAGTGRVETVSEEGGNTAGPAYLPASGTTEAVELRKDVLRRDQGCEQRLMPNVS